MQERVFMGIGYKPFMDIQPSDAAISDRAINCALAGRGADHSYLVFEPHCPSKNSSTSTLHTSSSLCNFYICLASVDDSLIEYLTLFASVLPECRAAAFGVPGSQGRFPALRPTSVRRTSSSGSHSSSSSSSSGRGSMSPVGYLCPINNQPVAGLSLSHPGVLEEDDLDQEQGNHHVLGELLLVTCVTPWEAVEDYCIMQYAISNGYSTWWWTLFLPKSTIPLQCWWTSLDLVSYHTPFVQHWCVCCCF